MDEFVAIVRIRPPTSPPPPTASGGSSSEGDGAEGALPSLSSAIGACHSRVVGVLDGKFDAARHALEFRFDRARSSVADIVRCLEDHGFTVTAVAQSKAEAQVQAATA